MNPELKKYIGDAKAAGFSDEMIREELVKAGWNPLDVKEALPTLAIPTPQPGAKKWLIPALLLLGIVLVVLGYMYAEKVGPFKETSEEVPAISTSSAEASEEEETAASAKIVQEALEEQRGKARDAQRIAEAQNLRLSLTIYYDMNGTYPLSLADIPSNLLSKMPKDSVGGYPYAYTPYAKAVWSAADAPATQCSASKPCHGFHLGISLENHSEQLMATDADVKAGTLNGDDLAPCTAAQTAGKYCYDLRN